MHHMNTASAPVGRVLNTLLLASCANRSVLTEHTSGQPRRIACCPYGSLPGHSRLAFNGEFREPQGWYHLGQGHRLYNPVLRRFNRPDQLSPFGKGGLNAYAYCLGDPVNFTDPRGEFASFPDFVKGVFYDRPSASMVLSGGLLLLNLVTAVLAPPVAPAALFALRTGLVGSVVGITGSSVQMAGHSEVGRYISIVGTIFSGVSVLTRGGLGLQKLRQDWSTISRDLGPRFRNIVMGGYKEPPVLRPSTPLLDNVFPRGRPPIPVSTPVLGRGVSTSQPNVATSATPAAGSLSSTASEVRGRLSPVQSSLLDNRITLV